MFDTITLYTYIPIDSCQFSRFESFIYLKEGELRTRYKLVDAAARIIYKDHIQCLEVECSIPKFLYGNNVILVTEQDIPLFFQRLHEWLHSQFGIQVKQENWCTKRVDVCWNFQVGDQMDSYIKELGKIKIPYTTPHTYGINETVIHENNSRRIIFYNKQKECQHRKQPRELIDSAAGLLRLEINVKEKNLSKYSKSRKATEFLTQSFFDFITKPILEKLQFSDDIPELTVTWVKSQPYSIQQIEMILGFNLLRQYCSEVELAELYSPQTYNKRKALANQIHFPDAKGLTPLVIEPKQTS